MADITARKTDIGPPHYGQFLPPVIKANYGRWKYHEIPRPGVLVVAAAEVHAVVQRAVRRDQHQAHALVGARPPDQLRRHAGGIDELHARGFRVRPLGAVQVDLCTRHIALATGKPFPQDADDGAHQRFASAVVEALMPG